MLDTSPLAVWQGLSRALLEDLTCYAVGLASRICTELKTGGGAAVEWDSVLVQFGCRGNVNQNEVNASTSSRCN